MVREMDNSERLTLDMVRTKIKFTYSPVWPHKLVDLELPGYPRKNLCGVPPSRPIEYL